VSRSARASSISIDIPDRIDRAVDVGHVIVLEAADDVGDDPRLADVGEKLVAPTLSLARAPDKTGDVDKLDHRRDDLLGGDDFGKALETLIRNGNDPDVGIDRTEGVVGRLGRYGGEGGENGGLANVGQPDDTDIQGHNGTSLSRGERRRSIA
jgi:hypothetical protein